MPVQDRSEKQTPVEEKSKKIETMEQKYKWDMRWQISETARTSEIQSRYRENLDTRLWSHRQYLADLVDPLDIDVICETIELLKRVNGEDVMNGYLQPGEFLAAIQVVIAGKHIPEAAAAPGV